MKLWLMRHGQAQATAASDAQRALTDVGRAQVRQAATVLPKTISRVLVSPYLRAQQTAALLLEGLLHQPELITVDWLVPETNPQLVVQRLDEYQVANLLLVAHQPLLGELAGLLIDGHRQQPLSLATAQVVELESEYWLAGSLQLCAQHRV